MTIEALIIWLVIGAAAGWLAGQIVKGYGFGLIGNIVVGIIGAVLAGWLLPVAGFVLVGGIIAAIIAGFVPQSYLSPLLVLCCGCRRIQCDEIWSSGSCDAVADVPSFSIT